jgi:hypothetical protein
MRFCALICLSLLLTAFFCAPIHKHDTGQDASCLFCHATTRAEWNVPHYVAGLPMAAFSRVVDKYASRAVDDEAELAVLIPRAPPLKLLSL